MRNLSLLTLHDRSVTPTRVGRKKKWAEDMQARFAEGTFARIEGVLLDGEDRTDFVREAVDREIKRRQRGLIVEDRAALKPPKRR